MLTDLILNICSIASLVACAFLPGISPFFSHAIIIVSLILFSILSYRTIKKKETFICRSEEKVIRTMYNILSKADGEIRIVSHRMSWLTNEIQNLLEMKKENVVVYMSKKTKNAIRLLRKGVTVKFYGHHHFVPTQRFTVIRYGRNNSQIAIGEGDLNATKYRHEIFLTSNKGNDVKSRWIKAIAMDMIELLDKVSEEKP